MSDICKACGHDKVFHQVGRGAGVPVGKEFCDDRHAPRCSCAGFVQSVVVSESDNKIAQAAEKTAHLRACIERGFVRIDEARQDFNVQTAALQEAERHASDLRALSDTAFKILEKERMDVVNWLKELQGRV